MDFFIDDAETPPKIVQSHASEFRTQSFEMRSLKSMHNTGDMGIEVFRTENDKYPSELQKTLMDFIVAYMLEQPNDMIDYAVTHFTKLQKSRYTAAIRIQLGKQSYGLNVFPSLDVKKSEVGDDSRRSSVYSETFSLNTLSDDDDRIIIPKSDKQRKRLSDAIKNSIIFNSLQTGEKYEVVNSMYEKNVCAGDIIIREGEEGDNFYVIEHGTYDVYRGVTHIDVITKGSFGEMALLYNAVRNATIQAMTDGKLWVMNRQTFRKILHAHEVKKQEKYKMLIKEVPLLNALDKWEKTKIIDAFVTKNFSKGDLILKQGDNANGVYFVESGVVALYDDRNDNQGNVIAAKLTKPQYFGHIELLAKIQYCNSAYAYTDVKCVFIDTDNFKLCMRKCLLDMIKKIIDEMPSDNEIIYKLRRTQLKIERGIFDL